MSIYGVLITPICFKLKFRDFSDWFFSLDDFWPQAEQKTLDHMDDESPPLGVEDYEKAKEWLFDLLKSGQASQHFNEENNRMELSIKG